MGIHARRRALAAALPAAAVVVAILLATSGSGAAGPPDAAARLVPADAMAFVDVSTDTGRDGVRRALALARRFPAFTALRDGLLRRLTAPGCGLARGEMHGREVAVAILPAGALVLLDTGRSAAPGPPRTCGAVGAEHLGRFLAVGTPAALSAARAVAEGRARALAGDELYRRAAGGLPAGRFADGYLSAAGLRTVLAPRGGLGAMAAALLDRGGLEAIGFAAEASAPGARLTLRELVPGATPAQSPRALLERVPAGVLFAADVGDLGAALDRLGAVLGGVSATEARELGRALPGETVLWLTPHTGTPTLTLVSQGSRAPGAPVRLGGRPLRAAVVAGHVVLSTRASGIAAARAPGPRLAAGVAYRSVLSGAPARVAALVFLDFSELLRLGEQTGLDANRAYRRVRNDLRKVREVGAVSTGDADQTTVQVELSIP